MQELRGCVMPVKPYSARSTDSASVDPEAFFRRRILILRPPVWTPKINIRINANMIVAAAATGRIGTYRKNAPKLPRMRTPRRTPTAVIRWRATPLAGASRGPIPARLNPICGCDYQRASPEGANALDINDVHRPRCFFAQHLRVPLAVIFVT